MARRDAGPPARPPSPGERGLASADPAAALALVTSAYGAAAHLARTLDLRGPSRLPGRTRHDVLVHLGAWAEHPVFSGAIEDARTGRVRPEDDVDARNTLLVAAHADEPPSAVAAALEQASSTAEAFLTGPDARTVGLRWTGSPVGPLPLTGLVVAAAYEVAVHLLDVADAADVPDDALDAGVAALVDVTGALAARAGVDVGFAVRTPTATWTCVARGEDWTTNRLDAGSHPPLPGLDGRAEDVLDAASGRVNAAQLVLTRRVRPQDVAGLLALLPALEAVPGLPGGAAARAALRTMGGTGRAVGRLGGLVRRGAR